MKYSFLFALLFLTFQVLATHSNPGNDISHTVNHHDGETCSVCHEKIDVDKAIKFSWDLPKDAVVKPFKCHLHAFHFGCASPWINRNRERSTCPLCRVPVDSSVLARTDTTGLVRACENGQIDAVRQILGQNTTVHDEVGEQALLAATKNGHLDILKILLADPHINSRDYLSATLAFAYRHGQLEAALVLGTDSRISSWTAGGLAGEYGDLKLVKMLLYGSRFSEELVDYVTAGACRRGRTEIVKFLLNAKKFAKHDFCDGLQSAIRLGRNEIAEMLLKSGRVDLNRNAFGKTSCGRACLEIAYYHGNQNMMKFLRDRGFN